MARHTKFSETSRYASHQRGLPSVDPDLNAVRRFLNVPHYHAVLRPPKLGQEELGPIVELSEVPAPLENGR